MSAPKSRRWETKSSGSPAQTSQSPTSQLTSFVESMSEVERATHRAAYLHLLQSITGCNVSVGLVGGKELTGVLHTATPYPGKENVVCVRASRLFQDGTPISNGANDGKTACVGFDKVTTITPSGKIDLVSKTYSTEFQTDSAIKKHGDMSHLSGRTLQTIDSSWLESSGDMTLDSKSGKAWDQFEVNSRLYNVKNTYDENLYTKKLDLKSMTAEQIATATRLAREIEGQASSNVHLQEERGQVTEGDWDEEDKYSGVLRSDGKKPKAAADAGNAWARGVKLGQAGSSGGSSPATVPAGKTGSGGAGSGKAMAAPPGVSKPTAEQATNNPNPSPKKPVSAAAVTEPATPTTPAPATAAGADATADGPAASSTKAAAAEAPASAAPAEAATAATSTAESATAAATNSGSATAPATPAPATKLKLRADAAEFKPSWMKDPSPAPPTQSPQQAPSTPNHPMVPPVGNFAPPPYATNVPYGMPDAQGGYAAMPNMMPHPGMVTSPTMGPMSEMAPPPPAYFDPNTGAMLPAPQYEFATAGGVPAYGMYPQGQMMPAGMPMPVPPPGGMPMEYGGMPVQMPMAPMMMPYPPPDQGQQFYQPVMMMPNMGPGPYPNQAMFGSPGSQPMYAQQGMGVYPNGMGSGQKMGYGDKNMRGPMSGNKGGRGSGMKPPYNSGGGGTPRVMPNGGMGTGPGTPIAGPGPSEGAGAGAP